MQVQQQKQLKTEYKWKPKQHKVEINAQLPQNIQIRKEGKLGEY